MNHKIITHKSKALAVLICFFIGSLGVHRFYLGNHTAGFAYLFCTIVSVASGIPELGMMIGLALIIETVYLLCKGKAYYRRVKEVELAA